MAQAFADKWTRELRRPRCERVVGILSDGKPKFEALFGRVDYRHSNSTMSRGVELVFYPESGGVYHAHYSVSWRRRCDVWFSVSDDGEIIYMSEAEALALARRAHDGRR